MIVNKATLKRHKVMSGAVVLLASSGVLLGAIRYTHRTPSVPTIVVTRGEFLDSLQFRGECSALKSISITAPAEVGELQLLKVAADGTKVKAGDPVVEFDKPKPSRILPSIAPR